MLYPQGRGQERYEPWFTFHGFRYVKLSGYPGEPRAEDFCAWTLSSAMQQRGSFSCSSADLNQLQSNICWSLRGNTLSIPTDCPQRERAGWTGDVQIIGETACFNLQASRFFEQWLCNVALEQKPDGQIPIVVPFIPSYQVVAQLPFAKDILPDNCTSAGWGDVITSLPWVLYQSDGDQSVLARYYENMKAWVEYIRAIAAAYQPAELSDCPPERAERLKYLWNTNFHFGDWLTPSVSLNPVTGKVDMEKQEGVLGSVEEASGRYLCLASGCYRFSFAKT